LVLGVLPSGTLRTSRNPENLANIELSPFSSLRQHTTLRISPCREIHAPGSGESSWFPGRPSRGDSKPRLQQPGRARRRPIHPTDALAVRRRTELTTDFCIHVLSALARELEAARPKPVPASAVLQNCSRIKPDVPGTAMAGARRPAPARAAPPFQKNAARPPRFENARPCATFCTAPPPDASARELLRDRVPRKNAVLSVGEAHELALLLRAAENRSTTPQQRRHARHARRLSELS